MGQTTEWFGTGFFSVIALPKVLAPPGSAMLLNWWRNCVRPIRMDTLAQSA